MNDDHQSFLNYFSTNPLSSNWYNIVDPQTIACLLPIDITVSATRLSDRRALKAAFKAFGFVTNEADGRQVTFPAASAGKMLYQSGTDIRAIASSFKLLFEKSIRAWDEKEVPMAGHKFHFNVSAYSNYISKFLLNGIEYFVRFTIRKIGQDSSVHASTISEVAIYRKTEGIPADSHLENPEDSHRMPFIDNKIAFFLAACQQPHSNIQTSKHPNIQTLLSRLHARLGDFWWYSLLLFAALRVGDVINAVVGLWLVPKYVGQEELGAVLPLTQFATSVGAPMTILVTVFTKYLNKFKTLGEEGKVKSMILWFVGIALVLVLLTSLIAILILPHFFERIRVTSGSLVTLIIATGILSTTSPVFMNALQGLKKFKTISLINLLGAPIRLTTMLVTMPFRALSGYMVGQASIPLFTIVASCFSLRKHVSKTIKAVPFWRSDGKAIFKYAALVGLSTMVGTLGTTITMMLLRQRLPAVESSAYYMISRFAELSTYAGLTLAYIMVPLVAEKATMKKSHFTTLLQSLSGTFLFGVLASAVLWTMGDVAFSIIPTCKPYSQYIPDMALLALVLTFSLTWSVYNAHETACERFSFMAYGIPISIANVAFLACFTGYTFFTGIFPESFVNWMGSLHIDTLRNFLLAQLAFAIIRLLGMSIDIVMTMPTRRATPRAIQSSN